MRLFILYLAVLSLCLSPVSCRAEEPGSAVEMLALNVGKADCILLRVEGHAYLVDTGYKRSSDQMLAMLAHEGVTHLDGVFLTHEHKDHYGGLNALVSSAIKIDTFYTSAYCLDGFGAKHHAVSAAAQRGQTVNYLKSGDAVEISDTARFTVLGPTKAAKDNENNNSLVMRLETAEGSILLTGDMKFDEEYCLITGGLLSQTDVLKVAFHGDNTSTSTSFLNAVKPRVGVISTSSAEEKDTPSRETLYRLASVGCKTYVTQDAPSAVRVTLSAGNIDVRMEDWQAD